MPATSKLHGWYHWHKADLGPQKNVNCSPVLLVLTNTFWLHSSPISFLSGRANFSFFRGGGGNYFSARSLSASLSIRANVTTSSNVITTRQIRAGNLTS